MKGQGAASKPKIPFLKECCPRSVEAARKLGTRLVYEKVGDSDLPKIPEVLTERKNIEIIHIVYIGLV